MRRRKERGKEGESRSYKGGQRLDRGQRGRAVVAKTERRNGMGK